MKYVNLPLEINDEISIKSNKVLKNNSKTNKI